MYRKDAQIASTPTWWEIHLGAVVHSERSRERINAVNDRNSHLLRGVDHTRVISLQVADGNRHFPDVVVPFLHGQVCPTEDSNSGETLRLGDDEVCSGTVRGNVVHEFCQRLFALVVQNESSLYLAPLFGREGEEGGSRPARLVLRSAAVGLVVTAEGEGGCGRYRHSAASPSSSPLQQQNQGSCFSEAESLITIIVSLSNQCLC